MQIPPRLPPGSSSFPYPKEGRVEGQGVVRGEVQNQPVKHAEERFEVRSKDFRLIRELIHRRFSTSGTPIPDLKEFSSLEKFVSEGPSLQYLRRIAVAKQFVEKKLPLSLEALRSFFRVLEGSSQSEEPSGKESLASTDSPTAYASSQTAVFPPLHNVQVKELLDQFNRGKNQKGKWFLLPFTCSLANKPFYVCLRLYVEEGAQTASKLVLSVRPPTSTKEPWHFVWYPHEPKRPLRVYPPFQKDKESSIPSELLGTFRDKLRKVGFLLDDNKNSSTEFDGFDEVEEKLQNIDMWI